MSIATAKQKIASDRFLLVRLNPARYIEPVLASGLYRQLMTVVPNRVERNGVALTKVTSTPSNDDEWLFDDSTSSLQIKLASAPDASTNVIVAYYYLYYTGTQYRAISEDPEDAETPTREWQPRLTSYPSILQSFENILGGVFTISDTTLSIINEDGSFQSYLTDDDSFYNKTVDIWLCIDDHTNIQRIFTGTIRGIALLPNTVTITAVDLFNHLKQPALMGDTTDEAYFRRSSQSFPNLDPQKHDWPCPYIVGTSSRFQTNVFDIGLEGVPPVYKVVVGTEAVCTNLESEISQTTNRTWGACRQKGSVATQYFGSVEKITASGLGYTFLRFAEYATVVVGDTMAWGEDGDVYYARIVYIGDFTYDSEDYNVIIETAETFTMDGAPIEFRSFCVFVKVEDEIIMLNMPDDYTVDDSTVTSGSNRYVEINFQPNFEASYASLSDGLDPQNHRVFFRTSNSVAQKHGDILKEFSGLVGLDVNSDSFTAADTALPVNCRFHIPNFDEQEYKPYLKYAQDVLASSLGYLAINAAFEVEYHLLAAPSSTTTRGTSLTLDGRTSARLEYADIATQVIAYNPHNDSELALDGADSPSETRESNKARYLHGIVNVDRFRHVLEEISSNIDSHIGLKASRRVKYSFSTSTEDVDTELGDDLQLNNRIVMGGSQSADVKVISIQKSPGSTRIEATDLKGL